LQPSAHTPPLAEQMPNEQGSVGAHAGSWPHVHTPSALHVSALMPQGMQAAPVLPQAALVRASVMQAIPLQQPPSQPWQTHAPS
jgi:hypothetical protein